MKFKIGQTKVRVIRKEDGKSPREIHQGIVVQEGSSFVRVFDNSPVNEGGNPSQSTSEQFPISAKNCWIEETGELKKAIDIAPEIR